MSGSKLTVRNAAPIVGSLFSWKSFWTNRSTTDDLPTAASPVHHENDDSDEGAKTGSARARCTPQDDLCGRIGGDDGLPRSTSFVWKGFCGAAAAPASAALVAAGADILRATLLRGRRVKRTVVNLSLSRASECDQTNQTCNGTKPRSKASALGVCVGCVDVSSSRA